MGLKQWIDRSFANNLTGKPAAGELTWDITGNGEFNTVVLSEDISKGQRVENFEVQANTADGCTTVADGTTIGKKRILMFPAVKASGLRIVIKQSRGKVNLLQPGTYLVEMPETTGEGLTGYVSAPSDGWKSADSSDITALTDGNPETIWTAPAGTQAITIDLGKKEDVNGFVYTPRNDGKTDGVAYHYTFSTSTDGKNWTPAKTSGEFSNIINNPIPQRVYLNAPIAARFVKLEVSETAKGDNGLTAAEFNVVIPQTGGK